jgi:hypothetical protein
MSGFPELVDDAVRLPPLRPASAQIAGHAVWLSALESRIARRRPSVSATQHLRRV